MMTDIAEDTRAMSPSSSDSDVVDPAAANIDPTEKSLSSRTPSRRGNHSKISRGLKKKVGGAVRKVTKISSKLMIHKDTTASSLDAEEEAIRLMNESGSGGFQLDMDNEYEAATNSFTVPRLSKEPSVRTDGISRKWSLAAFDEVDLGDIDSSDSHSSFSSDDDEEKGVDGTVAAKDSNDDDEPKKQVKKGKKKKKSRKTKKKKRTRKLRRSSSLNDAMEAIKTLAGQELGSNEITKSDKAPRRIVGSEYEKLSTTGRIRETCAERRPHAEGKQHRSNTPQEMAVPMVDNVKKETKKSNSIELRKGEATDDVAAKKNTINNANTKFLDDNNQSNASYGVDSDDLSRPRLAKTSLSRHGSVGALADIKKKNSSSHRIASKSPIRHRSETTLKTFKNDDTDDNASVKTLKETRTPREGQNEGCSKATLAKQKSSRSKSPKKEKKTSKSAHVRSTIGISRDDNDNPGTVSERARRTLETLGEASDENSPTVWPMGGKGRFSSMFKGLGSSPTTKSRQSLIFAKLFDEEDTGQGAGSKDSSRVKKSSKPAKQESAATRLSAVDRRLAGMEELELDLAKEKELLKKEREHLAFERESLEFQLEEEIQQKERLQHQIRQLEVQMEEQRLLGQNHLSESASLKEKLRAVEVKLEEERRQRQAMTTMQPPAAAAAETTNTDDDSVIDTDWVDDGKTKERLQGELLQANSKVTDLEALVQEQREQLGRQADELNALRSGNGAEELKQQVASTFSELDAVKEVMEKNKSEYDTKLKSKDETISFLIEELGNLKKAQSEARGGFLGSMGVMSLKDDSGTSKNEKETDMESSQHSTGALLRFAGFGK